MEIFLDSIYEQVRNVFLKNEDWLLTGPKKSCTEYRLYGIRVESASRACYELTPRTSIERSFSDADERNQTMLCLRPLLTARTALKTRCLVTVAQDLSSFNIPVINFAKFRGASSNFEKQKTADEIVSAFRETGFIYLSEHGIPQGTFTPSIGRLFCLTDRRNGEEHV